MNTSLGASMASLMAKKKKYKFQVDMFLEELLEVPFVSAVLFAKLRLLDGCFQDHSNRVEVRDHKVKWAAKFSFPCKIPANASTCVLERCILRISVRKECKGGRSFTKLGFVDLNLTEYAGAGVIFKKALLEGYDTRRRQDNSMLKFSIVLHNLSGDILFKVPSSVVKPTEDPVTIEQRSEDFSSGSLCGSIASSSSGFGSLTKKRTPLLSSDLLAGQNIPDSQSSCKINVASDDNGDVTCQPLTEAPTARLFNSSIIDELASDAGHSRNASSTSQTSKVSSYSNNTNSHSRQSSSGDSGHPKNQSNGNLVPSENGSLERAKAAYDRRKKIPAISPETSDNSTVTCAGKVEVTRINADHFIEELIQNSNLASNNSDTPEVSGLQLYIADDGTTALGNHEVKSQMSSGVQHFKQVVIDDKG